jgi:cellulose synthase/poly-beta-1,6-N-acetylglucosamine synthase-like glycosyltransferase
MDYQDFEVIFTVESEEDPAAAVVRRAIRTSPRASLVVAGLAQTCAQKNWNMLRAVREANAPDVYVFADADIVPGKSWLRELVLPLSNQSIAAATGFRWLLVTRGRLGEYNQAFFNGFLYMLFLVASFVGNVGLWGGSMAIRRKDFEELGVAERWSETAVDDLSLAEIIMKNSRSSVLVPACVTVDEDPIQSLPDSIRWIERQMMFLKMYHTALWIPAVPVILLVLLVLAWLPVAAILSLGDFPRFLQLGGGVPLSMIAIDMLASVWFPVLGGFPRFGRFFLMLPLLRFLMMYSLARTITTNTITWSGVEYRVKVRTGKVINLTRPGN